MLGAAPATETVAVWVAAPPGPRHVSSNSVVLVMASVDSEPLVETDPVQPPELVQLVAPLLLQVRIALAPGATVDAVAVNVTVGASAVEPDPPDWAPLCVTPLL
jgi:hypothetical protein